MIEVRAVRIIPFQIGAPLTSTNREILFRFLLDTARWSCIRVEKHTSLDIFDTGYVLYRRHRRLLETIDFNEDGVGVLTIFDEPTCYGNIDEIDPEDVNFKKGLRNREILEDGPIRSEVDDIISHMSGYSHPSTTTFTNSATSPDYVFSAFMFRMSSKNLRAPGFNPIIRELLYPHRTFQVMQSPLHEMSDPRSTDIEVIDETLSESEIESLPFRRAYFSWACAVLCGDFDNSAMKEFLKTIRELQAIWVYAFNIEKQLDQIIDEMHSRRRHWRAFEILSRSSHLTLLSRNYTTIGTGRARMYQIERNRKILRNSMLGEILQNVALKTDLIKEAISVSRDEQIRETQKVFEIVLLVLAGIQALSAYVAITTAQGEVSTWAYIIFSAVLIVGLIAILARRR